MRSLIPLSRRSAARSRDPRDAALGAVLGDRSCRLVVLKRTVKLMDGARRGCDGRIRPAATAPLMICTHRPTGKTWGADHATSRMRRAAR